MSASLKVHRSTIPSLTVADFEGRLVAWEKELQDLEDQNGRIISIVPRPGSPFEFFVVTRGEDHDSRSFADGT